MSSGITTHKFTLALNKSIGEDLLYEVAAKAALSLSSAGSAEDIDKMRFLSFSDADGHEHTHVSALSLIVMRGKAGELRKFRESAKDAGLPFVDITRSMLIGDSMDKRVSADREPEYLGVMVFGDKDRVNSTTGKMSLWK